MRQPEIQIVPATSVRRSLIGVGDIRAEIAYQNDINNLLAQFEESRIPWRALAAPAGQDPVKPAVRRASVRVPATPPVLRIFDGGGLVEAPTLAQARGVAPDAVRVIGGGGGTGRKRANRGG
jgi:hypothetical protein